MEAPPPAPDTSPNPSTSEDPKTPADSAARKEELSRELARAIQVMRELSQFAARRALVANNVREEVGLAYLGHKPTEFVELLVLSPARCNAAQHEPEFASRR